MDFSTPSLKQVSYFFMYLYQDLNRHPSTIDGYRTATVDTFGPTGLHISQSSDLNRLLSSFHRDRPESSRNLPKWNLSVVLNELTKAPFGPMKDTDLKHLTLKTSFLLALASGKRRSKIHAWVANKVSNLGQWDKQINKPWTYSKSRRMTLGPSRPLRPFTVGYRWTKSCKHVTGKLTTHLQIFYLKDLT